MTRLVNYSRSYKSAFGSMLSSANSASLLK